MPKSKVVQKVLESAQQQFQNLKDSGWTREDFVAALDQLFDDSPPVSKQLVVPEWTKLFSGTSYVRNLPPGYQITLRIANMGPSEVYLLNLRSLTPFLAAKTFTGPEELCRQKASEWLNELLKT